PLRPRVSKRNDLTADDSRISFSLSSMRCYNRRPLPLIGGSRRSATFSLPAVLPRCRFSPSHGPDDDYLVGRGGPGGGHRRFHPPSTSKETEGRTDLSFPVQRLQAKAQIHGPPGRSRGHVPAVPKTAEIPGCSDEEAVTPILTRFIHFEA